MALNCVLQPRLEELSLRKAVIMLWDEIEIVTFDEIRIDMPGSYGRLKKSLEKRLEQIKELADLRFPRLLVNKLKPLFKPIGSEIIKWIDFHVRFLRDERTYFLKERLVNLGVLFDRKILNNLSWTSVGTVNYKKTAQELIRRESLDARLLYKLACLYCLEDDIPAMWEKFPDNIKLQICGEGRLFQAAHMHVKDFWSEIISKDDFSLFTLQGNENVDPFFQRAFKISAYTRNKAATEYFYQKLTNTQKEAVLLETVKLLIEREDSCVVNYDLPKEKYADVLCYLLSHMIPDQQVELFTASAYDILSVFLVWPWQDLFLDIAEFRWDLLPQEDYYCLLQDLEETDAISKYYKEDIFEEFFQSSPENLKNYFIDQECQDGNFMRCLFGAEKSEFVRSIFRNVDASAKARLALCNQGQQICLYLILENKWDLLKLFIEEAKLSKEDREKLKEYLKPRIEACNGAEMSRSKIEAWEHILHTATETDGSTP